jgi:hypothetical protein
MFSCVRLAECGNAKQIAAPPHNPNPDGFTRTSRLSGILRANARDRGTRLTRS